MAADVFSLLYFVTLFIAINRAVKLFTCCQSYKTKKETESVATEAVTDDDKSQLFSLTQRN